MDFLRIPKKIRIYGNHLLGHRYIGEANSLINTCLNAARFQSLDQYSISQKINDNVFIVAVKSFDVVEARIFARLQPALKEDKQQYYFTTDDFHLCVIVENNLGETVRVQFRYDYEKSTFVFGKEAQDTVDCCASKLIVKDSVVPNEKVKYLVVQEEIKNGRVNIIMDGETVIHCTYMSPDSYFYPYASFIYNQDYVYAYTTQGTTHANYDHIVFNPFGIRPAPKKDRGGGIMYKLSNHPFTLPELVFFDPGGPQENNDALPVNDLAWDGGTVSFGYTDLQAQYLTLGWDFSDPFNLPPEVPGELSYIRNYYISGFRTSFFEQDDYEEFKYTLMPLPLYIYADDNSDYNIGISKFKKRRHHDSNPIVYEYTYSEPWVYEYIDSDDEAYIVDMELSSVKSIEEYNAEYCLASSLPSEVNENKEVEEEKLTPVIDEDWTLFPVFGVNETKKPTDPSRIIKYVAHPGEGGSISCDILYREGFDGTQIHNGASVSVDNVFYKEEYLFGTQNTIERRYTFSGYGERRYLGSEAPAEVNRSNRYYVKPMCLCPCGDIPVFCGMSFYDGEMQETHGYSRWREKKTYKVFYNDEFKLLPPVEAFSHPVVRCHDMRQAGNAKIVAIKTSVGWEIFVEDQNDKPKNVTADFFQKLNQRLGTAYNAGGDEVKDILPVNVGINEKTAFEKEIFRLINQEREAEGLQPLVALQAHVDIARKHSDYMTKIGEATHEGSDERKNTLEEKIESNTNILFGENVAWGPTHSFTAADMVNGWMNSSGHRANILNTNFVLTIIGVSLRYNEVAATQLFIG